MDPKEYRQQVLREIEAVRARKTEERLEGSAPVEASLGVLTANVDLAHPNDLARARGWVEDKEHHPELRAAALGRLRSNQELEEAVGRLGDTNEPPEVRLAAIAILEEAAFGSEAFDEVRPAFLTAALRGEE